ncbi:hypothetical protein LCGC14_3128530 [marine sediment metagenome]|uniref:Uncharacterized protein n=1 Tax=marine sediment metagenome TaxID=412755 RepID=A0A0F8W0C1_9ZZZZ
MTSPERDPRATLLEQCSQLVGRLGQLRLDPEDPISILTNAMGQAIAEAHGGRIDSTSVEGAGPAAFARCQSVKREAQTADI